jgi:hypothetical protein
MTMSSKGLLLRFGSVVLLLLLSSCATVVRGTKQTVRIESNPPGAKIHLSTGGEGVTPATFELPRKDLVVVDFEKEGHESMSVTLVPMRSKSGSIAGAGNALIGGAIGGAIDGGTGATLDLQPNPLIVTLRPIRDRSLAANWAGMATGLARRDVRDLLGEPATIFGDTGDQLWTYPDGGTVQFQKFFVTVWNAPKAG